MMLPLLYSTLLLLSASLADQYEQQSSHRFNVPSPRALDLQVGCAEGSLNHENHNHERHNHNHKAPILQVLKRHRRQTDQQRQKRDYIQWYGSSTTYHRPTFVSSYQIQSPLQFYVPIWGNPGRIPVFFPSKPILINPGYPIHNPPGVRPTVRPTTTEPTTDDGIQITIGNRVNVPTTNEEGLPIWGIVESDPTGGSSRPNQVPGSSRPANNRPTRPPTPPLLHRPSITDSENQRGQESQQGPPVVQQFPSRFVTTTVRPQTTTRRPQQSQGSSQGQRPQEPSRCVWAIISCCNPTNTQVSYNCFERLGCPGLFVDGSPCTRENTAAALNAASQFYAQS